MTTNASTKVFYDKLYKEDKDFIYQEFTNRVSELKKSIKDQALDNYKALLREVLLIKKEVPVNEHTSWKNVKDILKKDKRYSDLKSSSLRERLFEEFIME